MSKKALVTSRNGKFPICLLAGMYCSVNKRDVGTHPKKQPF